MWSPHVQQPGAVQEEGGHRNGHSVPAASQDRAKPAQKCGLGSSLVPPMCAMARGDDGEVFVPQAAAARAGKGGKGVGLS